ncbi:MAG: bifunctional DNA-formamidopyrimidine glycosylase/DNA-(apurinic or apyrimidinic site) lyase [Burkholderiaceae bacterium]
MPELPEVEVTRIGLADRLAGATVLGVRRGKALRWPLGCRPDALRGMTIGTLARRGKYIWMPLAAASGRQAGLLWHLGMSGSLALLAPGAPAGAHDHFDLLTSAGTLRLTDPRRFGAVVWSASLDADPARRLLDKLGPEPFDPGVSADTLRAACARRRTSIKAALLSGELVVGAGNIYACEALFAAGIDPRARCHTLGRARLARLLDAVRQVLARAIELGGSTLRDFRDAHGVAGSFQAVAQVYGREGEACPRCGTTIRRIVQAQRSTYFCPRCQRR